MAKGIVVQSLSTGTYYARSEHNFNPEREKKVRDLRPGETVLGFEVRETDISPGEDYPVLFEITEETDKEGRD